MAKYINIKTDKPLLCSRAPLLINARRSKSAKAARYNKYQLLYNYYHPNLSKKTVEQPIVKQLQMAVETELSRSKTKWYDLVPHWIVELFTRDKSGQEILPTTA